MAVKPVFRPNKDTPRRRFLSNLGALPFATFTFDANASISSEKFPLDGKIVLFDSEEDLASDTSLTYSLFDDYYLNNGLAYIFTKKEIDLFQVLPKNSPKYDQLTKGGLKLGGLSPRVAYSGGRKDAEQKFYSGNTKELIVDGVTYKEVLDNASPLGVGQIFTNLTYVRRRWENSEDTVTPSMFSSIEEMFLFSKAHVRIPRGAYEFQNSIIIRDNATILMDPGSTLVPAWQPLRRDWATPLVALGKGVQSNRIEVMLREGTKDIAKVLTIASDAKIGSIKISSSRPIYNRFPEADGTETGAVIVQGNRVNIQGVEVSNFDVGMRICKGLDVSINGLNVSEVITGIIADGIERLYLRNFRVSGPKSSTFGNSFDYGKGIMSPGANGLLIQGVRNGWFSNGYIEKTFEHGIRVGGMHTGKDKITPNENLTFNNITISKPYGCGFKADDGDLYLNKNIQISNLTTIDVGNNNWYGISKKYQNWSRKGMNLPRDNVDGNKAACAIRNVDLFQIHGFKNICSADHIASGHRGLWIERSDNGNVYNVDINRALKDGVVIQGGKGKSISDIQLHAVRSTNNGRDGVVIEASPMLQDDHISGLSMSGVYSSQNRRFGLRVTTRADGSAPFSRPKSIIQGYSTENMKGPLSMKNSISRGPNLINEFLSLD